MNKLILLCFSAILLHACGGNEASPGQNMQAPTPAPEVKNIILVRDSVLLVKPWLDSSQSYALYYPAAAAAPASCPVILCFDPHGGGRIPVDKYKKWAKKYGVVIAGSYSSRNGLSLEQGGQICNNIVNDLTQRMGFSNSHIALCGFSGGAKVALNAAQISGIVNVIYIGAAAAATGIERLNLLGFAGRQDMNYTDLLQFFENTSGTNPNSEQIEFPGKHEWPDELSFETAFYWLRFQVEKPRPDSALITSFLKKTETTMAAAAKNRDIVSYFQACRFAYHVLNGLSDVTKFKLKMDSVSASQTYLQALAFKNEVLSAEANQKQMLLQAFQNQDLHWWEQTIKRFKSSTNPSDKRLLGFISLACYSYSNQLIQQQNLEAADKFLAIYELCDPLNTDQLYFHAVLNSLKGNAAISLNYLEKAVSNGFNDPSRIISEPAFKNLAGINRFKVLLSSLNKAPR